MSYGMDGWNHDNDLVRRKDVMDSLVKEYNRRFSLGERDGLKLAWIEKAVNEVNVAQQGKIQLPEEAATKGATSDCISRAAAIDALGEKPLAWMESEYAQGLQNQWVWDVNALKALPSAQPEIVRCKDCKHRYIDGENVRYNVCDLNHNKVQGDYWYCADGERKDD